MSEQEEKTSLWPEDFYHATDYETRKECLKKAVSGNLEAADSYRNTLLEYRYGAGQSHGDSFTYAWLMMLALSENGFFFKKAAKKRYMKELTTLMLPAYEALDENQKEFVRQEWRHLGLLYIYTCVNSKSYGSVLGLIPLKRDTRAQKIADNITLAAKTYPARLGLGDMCAPLYEAMKEVFDQAISLGQ